MCRESERASARRALFLLPLALAAALAAAAAPAAAQRGLVEPTGEGHILYGDFKVEGDESASPARPAAYHVILYSGGQVVARQTVTSNGRYRFNNVYNGVYDLAVEVENTEVTRMSITLRYISKTDVRQDINLEWRGGPAGGRAEKPATLPAADSYKRSAANQTRFDKAQEALKSKRPDEAIILLGEIVAADPKDFAAWTDLGTLHFRKGHADDAEKALRRALEERPSFALALLNLGALRLSKKDYQGAIEPLARAVELQPTSADSNYFLGEAYLGIKKGSKAVGYLNEALRLDPLGKADAHLRLAALYNGAGLKDRAAAEFEQFLKKRPDHPDRKKLEQYIRENSKQ